MPSDNWSHEETDDPLCRPARPLQSVEVMGPRIRVLLGVAQVLTGRYDRTVSQPLEQCHEENCCWVWVHGHGDCHDLDERERSRLPERSLLSDVRTLRRCIGTQSIWRSNGSSSSQAHSEQKAAELLDFEKPAFLSRRDLVSEQ
jgi:hypothetical protein